MINLGTSFLRQDEAQLIEEKLKLEEEKLNEDNGEGEDGDNFPVKSKTTWDFSGLKILNKNRDKKLDAYRNKKMSNSHKV